MYPYHIFVVGHSNFNNYFLFSYYTSLYVADKAILCTVKPSNINVMAEVFASEHNLIHLACDTSRVLQQLEYPSLCKKIANACRFALIFKNENNPDSSQHYEQLLDALVKFKREYRIIDISSSDIITNERRKLSNRVKFSDMYGIYLQKLSGDSSSICYKFISLVLHDPALMNTVINHHGVEYITENPIEEQIACQLDWIDANMYGELKELYKSAYDESDTTKTIVKELVPTYKI